MDQEEAYLARVLVPLLVPTVVRTPGPQVPSPHFGVDRLRVVEPPSHARPGPRFCGVVDHMRPAILSAFDFEIFLVSGCAAQPDPRKCKIPQRQPRIARGGCHQIQVSSFRDQGQLGAAALGSLRGLGGRAEARFPQMGLSLVHQSSVPTARR